MVATDITSALSSTVPGRSADDGTRAPGRRTRTEALQRRPAPGPATPTEAAAPVAPAMTDDPFALHLASGAGAGHLPPATAARMGAAFGTDFADVRIHQGGEAAAMGARAFTQGEDIHFAPGAYDPTSPAGLELIGHELTHVVQQRAGRVSAPQGKGAPINADPGLEAEADALGARAARGEVVALATGIGGRGGGGVVQRFKDPETDDEIALDRIGALSLGDVTRFLALIQSKDLRPTGGEFRALQLRKRRLQTGSDEDLLSESVVSSMDLANTGGGLNYLHNVPTQDREQLEDDGRDPATGHANPDYFDKIGRFTWRLKPGVSAAAAIRDFVTPQGGYTIAECQTALQASFYLAILNAVGHVRFDAKLGREDLEVPANQRLLLQLDLDDDNPLNLVFESFTMPFTEPERSTLLDMEDGTFATTEDFRPVAVGGWYYMKNHEFYSRRHQGIWGGENAIHTGVNQDGHQVFSGFGLADKTEREMAEFLARECNAAPTSERSQRLIASGEFGLALPRLGDLESLDELELTSADAINVINRHAGLDAHARQQALQHPEAGAQARDRLRQLLAHQVLPQPVTADDIIRNHVLDHQGMGIGVDQNANGQLTRRDLSIAWAEAMAPGDRPCVAMTLTKGAKGTQATVDHKLLMSLYCEQYRLDLGLCITKGKLHQLFSALNPDYQMVRLGRGEVATLYYPRPEFYARVFLSGAGLQSVGGRNLDVAKLKQVFGAASLFAEDTVPH